MPKTQPLTDVIALAHSSQWDVFRIIKFHLYCVWVAVVHFRGYAARVQ